VKQVMASVDFYQSIGSLVKSIALNLSPSKTHT